MISSYLLTLVSIALVLMSTDWLFRQSVRLSLQQIWFLWSFITVFLLWHTIRKDILLFEEDRWLPFAFSVYGIRLHESVHYYS